MVNGYSCACAPGFYGLSCETEVNECDPHPCVNQGNCTDLLGDYSCTCLLEFTVREFSLDDESSVKKHNNYTNHGIS